MSVEEYALRRRSSGANEASRSRRETGLPDPRDDVSFNWYSDRFRIPGASSEDGRERRPVFSWSEREKRSRSSPSQTFLCGKATASSSRLREEGATATRGSARERTLERDLREGLITEEEAREVFGLEREAVT